MSKKKFSIVKVMIKRKKLMQKFNKKNKNYRLYK